jgi:pimeloyl-ACP methyl ester carboxylesterase
MTALRAAVQSKDIAGIIEAAAVGTNGKEVLIAQQYLIPKSSGYSEDESQWNQRLYSKGAEIALSTTAKDFQKKYGSWLDQVWDSIPSVLLNGASKADLLVQMNAFFNNDWARQFLAFEAASYLSYLDLPFLIINGSKDVQVPALSNQEGFKKSMSAATLKLSSFELIEGANHLFQQCERCSLTEYASLEQTLDPVLMQHVTSWILEQQQAHR